MKKAKLHKVIMFLFLIALVMSLGCSGTTTRDEEGDVDFRRGTRGLEMRFLDENPPYEVYEGDILNIGIEMFNRGTASVLDGRLYLTGYDPAIINRETGGPYDGFLPSYGQAHVFEILESRNQFNEEGGYDLIEFWSDEIRFPSGSGITTYEVPLVAYACYTYETLASGDVCVDPQPHRTFTDKPCYTQDVVIGGGQGAPVAITHIDVANMRDQIRLTFTVQNVGEGTVVDEMKLFDYCPTSFTPADIDRVYVDYVTLGTEDITSSCKPIDWVKLNNGYGKIICTWPIGGTTAYMTTIDMKLSYGYRTFIRKDIQILGYY